jgi:hypothetical protein
MAGLGDFSGIITKFGDIGEKFGKHLEKLSKITNLNEVINSIKSNFDIDVVADKMLEVENASANVINLFGTGREHILAIKANLVDSVTEVTKLGKGFQDIADTQVSISTELNRN